MHYVRLILLVFIISCLPANAQPPVDFVHTFDLGCSEIFYDIYAVSDDGYLSCGATARDLNHLWGGIWLMKTDQNGNEIWSQTYEDGINGVGYSVIETDDGNFLIGAVIRDAFGALLTDSEGELIWSNV